MRKISPEELRRFVKEKFLPHRMAFTVVADIEEARMEKEVRKIVDGVFGKSGETELSQNKDRLSTKGPTASGGPAHRRFDITLNKRNHQANCTIGGLAPSLYQERDRLATVLMCNILGGPANNSRLNSVLREKNGWVYGVECGYTQYADTGIVTISLGCDKANVDRCLRAIRKELDKLQNETMSDRKLKAARKQLLGQLAISGDNGETQCLSMGKSLLAFGKIAGSEENKEMVEGITAEDIRRMAREIFAPERLSQLIYI